MSFTKDDFASELVGYIPKLSAQLAPTLVDRAYADILKERLWSFLVEDGALVAPDAIATGSIAVTQFANPGLVTGNAAASAAWLPQVLSTPPFTSRQFTMGSGSPRYNIESVDVTNPAAIVLQLDRMYTESTVTASSYQIFRCFFAPPAADFRRWVSIWDANNGYTIYPRKPYWNHAMLNIIDPLRSNQGQPIRIVPYKADDTGGPLYEMWPAPTTLRAYQCNYERNGVALASNESLPVAIPDNLLAVRLKMKGAEWAILNAGQYPELKGVDWRLLLSTYQTEYKDVLGKALKADEETFRQNFVIPRNRRYPAFPVDGKYLQSHDPIG